MDSSLQDDLEIRLDSRKDSAPSGQPPTPPGISSVHKYVRPGGEQAAARKPPQAQQSEGAQQHRSWANLCLTCNPQVLSSH